MERNKKVIKLQQKEQTPIPTNPEEALIVLKEMLSKMQSQQKVKSVSNKMASSMLSKQFGIDSSLVDSMIDIRQQEELMHIAALEIAIEALTMYNKYNWDEEEGDID